MCMLVQLIVGVSSKEELQDLCRLLDFLAVELAANRNFEFVQALLRLTLQVCALKILREADLTPASSSKDEPRKFIGLLHVDGSARMLIFRDLEQFMEIWACRCMERPLCRSQSCASEQ